MSQRPFTIPSVIDNNASVADVRRVSKDRSVYSSATSTSAFSLIELLVVVGILSILLAVAMPSWQSVRAASAVREARIVLERLTLRRRSAIDQRDHTLASDGMTVIRFDTEGFTQNSGALVYCPSDVNSELSQGLVIRSTGQTRRAVTELTCEP